MNSVSVAYNHAACCADTAAKRTSALCTKICAKIAAIACKIFNAIFPLNPVTKSRQFRVIPTKLEKAYGESFYNSLCPQSRVDNDLTDDYKPIFDKLVEACDRKDLDYEFRVLDSNVVNAFCLPGGKIVITRGLIDKLKEDNVNIDGFNVDDVDLEDKIAAVLGHEITHASAGHSAMKIQTAILLWLTGRVLSFSLGIFVRSKVIQNEQNSKKGKERINQASLNRKANTAATISTSIFDVFWNLGNYFAQNKYGHSHEFQSDRIGMKYAARAGYNPAGAVYVQQMFVDNFGKGNKALALFSTHPPSQERVNQCINAYKKISLWGLETVNC